MSKIIESISASKNFSKSENVINQTNGFEIVLDEALSKLTN